MAKLLITGAQGFLGRALCYDFLRRRHYVRVLVRKNNGTLKGAEIFEADLSSNVVLDGPLIGIDCVVHLAGLAHEKVNRAGDPKSQFMEINCLSVLNIARQAIEHGVKRFIFVSSIGVNGESNLKPFKEDGVVRPSGPYAISKWKAEVGLWDLCKSSDMELVVIRPPLIYGPSAPGNFGKLVRVVSQGVPLPLGLIRNKRSFLAVGNFVSFVLTCIEHPLAANETFLISDGDDISTTNLIKMISKALSLKTVLVPVPVCVLVGLASFVGKKKVMRQLCDSLQVDITKAEKILGWRPPISLEDGIQCVITAPIERQ